MNCDHSDGRSQGGWAAAEHVGFAIICCVTLLGAFSLAVQMQSEMIAGELVDSSNSR
jgi:hypothetical protein